jgi:MFS family permease
MMVDRYKLEAEVKALKAAAPNNEDKAPFQPGRFRARFMTIYLNLFREYTGINTILVYSSLIIGQTNSSLGPYSNFVIAIVGFVATVASHLLLRDRFGRRILMMAAAIVCTICNIVIMVGMLISNTAVVFAPMLVAIFFFGITYSTVSSIYPGEIMKNERASYSTFTAWPAMMMVTLVPPLLADVISPTHTPWPIFLFFALFSLLSVFYLGRFAVESKDKQYYDIIK